MTDNHEYLRKAHQAANDFKYGYVTISNSALGALLAERDALRKALETMVKAGEMNGTGRAYAMKVARTALAQEQEEA